MTSFFAKCQHEGSYRDLEKAAVEQQCRALRFPAVAEQCAALAEEAVKQRQTYLDTWKRYRP